MQEVHYFQRFSKKEDVVTNNTLLLFKRIQHHNTLFFQDILQELLADENLTVGAVMTEQEAAGGKIADGVIRQSSFHVVLETKLHASFDGNQLKGHLEAFNESNDDLQVLLLLGTQEPAARASAEEIVAKFNQKNGKSVRLVWTTFAIVVDKCRDAIPEHERALLEILDDYSQFCNEAGLLSGSDAGFLIMGCSQSLPDNLKLRLYYDPRRSHRPAKYIGFYKDKAVQAIGLLEKVVRVDRGKEGLILHEGGPLTDDQASRIEKAMDLAPTHGWDINHGCYFFLAGAVEETVFRKDTKYPLRGRRYLDLREILELDPSKSLPSLPSLAKELHDRTW